MSRTGEQSARLISGLPVEVRPDDSVLDRNLEVKKIAGIIRWIVAWFIKLDCGMIPI